MGGRFQLVWATNEKFKIEANLTALPNNSLDHTPNDFILTQCPKRKH